VPKVNKTTDKDLGAIRIIQEAKTANTSFVEIGVFEEAGEHTSSDGLLTVAEVAFFNEFGTLNAPERSFIRSTIDDNRRELEQLTAKLFRQIVEGKTDTKKALDKLGFKIQTLIQQRILKLNDPANAPSTIEAKGFNNPLVDSRELHRSIAFETVIKKGVG